MKSDLIYVQHIQECIHKIVEYTKDISEDQFLKNSMISDAVIRNFEIIGEATKKISPAYKSRYPDIEWKKIAGMRDKLIHDYIGVDLWAVWAVVEDIIPVFRKQIDAMLDTE